MKNNNDSNSDLIFYVPSLFYTGEVRRRTISVSMARIPCNVYNVDETSNVFTLFIPVFHYSWEDIEGQIDPVKFGFAKLEYVNIDIPVGNYPTIMAIVAALNVRFDEVLRGTSVMGNTGIPYDPYQASATVTYDPLTYRVTLQYVGMANDQEVGYEYEQMAFVTTPLTHILGCTSTGDQHGRIYIPYTIYFNGQEEQVIAKYVFSSPVDISAITSIKILSNALSTRNLDLASSGSYLLMLPVSTPGPSIQVWRPETPVEYDIDILSASTWIDIRIVDQDDVPLDFHAMSWLIELRICEYVDESEIFDLSKFNDDPRLPHNFSDL